MSNQFEDIQRQIVTLPAKDKAALAHQLIEALEDSTDPDAERLWLAEATQRYEAYQRGDLASREGDEVRNARKRLE
jgi:hypothetical protein